MNEDSYPVRLDLLRNISTPSDLKLGVSANIAAHTNELIGGVTFALEKHNLPIEIIWENDGRLPHVAKNAATKLSEHNVFGVVGHLSASAALGALPVYMEHNIPFMAPGTTHPSLTSTNHNMVLRCCALDEDQAEFICGSLEKEKIALLYQDIEYGHALKSLIEEKSSNKIIGIEAPLSGIPEHILDETLYLNATKIILIGTHEFVAEWCTALRENNYKGNFITGDDGWTENFIRLGSNSVENIQIAVPFIEDKNKDIQDHVKKLTNKYMELFEEQAGVYFFTSYIATDILLQAKNLNQSVNGSELYEIIKSAKWTNELGTYSFNDIGDIQGLKWQWKTIKNKLFRNL